MNKPLYEFAKIRICYTSFESHFEQMKSIQNLYIGYHEKNFLSLAERKLFFYFHQTTEK